MRFGFSLVCLLLIATSCQNPEETSDEQKKTENVDLNEVLQGTWQTYQLNVAVNSADGLDSFRAEFLNQKIWEEVHNRQPPIYYFQANQKYRQVFLDLGGNLLSETQGTWTTIGDTLKLEEPEISYSYVVKQSNGRAGFRTFLDWDGDGAEDDEYQSLQRQISIGTN